MALYPDVKCKVLYQRDYLQLLIKYGLEQPSQGPLSPSRPQPVTTTFDEAVFAG